MTGADCVLGVDLGTSSVKAVLVDRDGRILGQGRAEYGFVSLHSLWAEQSSDVWLHAFTEAVRETLLRSGVAAQNVRGMAVSAIGGGTALMAASPSSAASTS